MRPLLRELVAWFSHQDERILGQAFLKRPAGAPGRRDLAKPQKGSPSTCGAGAIHILALQSNLMAPFGWRRDEHDDLVGSIHGHASGSGR
jgi:hypothetical protein